MIVSTAAVITSLMSAISRDAFVVVISKDRGCAKSHPLHELFCAAAKCFAVSLVHAAAACGEDDDDDGVLLQIMIVRGPRKGVSSQL